MSDHDYDPNAKIETTSELGAAASITKPSRLHVTWDVRMVFEFLSVIRQHQGHLTTTATMKTKWEEIRREFYSLPANKDIPPATVDYLRGRFYDMRANARNKYLTPGVTQQPTARAAVLVCEMIKEAAGDSDAHHEHGSITHPYWNNEEGGQQEIEEQALPLSCRLHEPQEQEDAAAQAALPEAEVEPAPPVPTPEEVHLVFKDPQQLDLSSSMMYMMTTMPAMPMEQLSEPSEPSPRKTPPSTPVPCLSQQHMQRGGQSAGNGFSRPSEAAHTDAALSPLSSSSSTASSLLLLSDPGGGAVGDASGPDLAAEPPPAMHTSTHSWSRSKPAHKHKHSESDEDELEHEQYMAAKRLKVLHTSLKLQLEQARLQYERLLDEQRRRK